MKNPGGGYCPEVEHAPHTIEGAAVLAAINRAGVWDYNAWSGSLIGLKLIEAMAGLPDDADRSFARELFVVAEAAFVKAATEESEKRTGKQNGS